MKVVIGFSGGVDSAVAATLLKRAGHEVHAVYLDNTNEASRMDAVNTAAYLGIPLTVLDVREELREKVEEPFCQSYLRGETPNPCILCNPRMKFKNLIAIADELGAEKVATGHYARCENGKLLRGRPSNDQSYMLSGLRREQLLRVMFPLGVYEKTEVRALAEQFGIPVAHKPDSMEICFIPDKDYLGWISRRYPLPGAGDVLLHAKVIGQHEGICRYTVGQRYPGLIEERKVYISRIDAKNNTITLDFWDGLFASEVFAANVNWLIDPPEGELHGQVRVRHTKWEMPECTVRREGDSMRIFCETPVRAPAPGQSAVVYDGDRVIASGIIR